MSEMASSFEGPLRAALRHGLAFLEASGEASVGATVGLARLRERLAVPLGDGGVDATRVIEELVQGVEGGILGSAGPRFFAWVVGGAVPAALAADWLTAVWDQNAALYACAPAAAVVEEVAGEWLKELLRLPASASFALVTGCQMAHVTCLAAARHALLALRGWDVEADGLAGAPAIRILTSTEKHGSTVRAVRLLGMGTRRIVGLAVDELGRLRADALADELEKEPGAPTIVVLQAGDLNLGAYDDFQALIPMARRFGAWVHVDGAFGLWAAASPRLRHLMTGAENADSWTTDGHKWLNVPYDSGYAFVADPDAHRASMSHRAAYLTHDAEARDEMDWNPEWSRRGRGFATYAALREMGRDGVAGLIERTCDCARALVVGMGTLDGAEVVWEPTINQGLVRFVPFAGTSGEECDGFTDRVMAEILTSGEAMFTGTTWRRRRAMRVSVCNWRTSAEDVERVVRCVEEILQRLREERTTPFPKHRIELLETNASQKRCQMSQRTFFIAGITGNVGGAAARQLLSAGHAIRTLARNPQKAAEWSEKGVDVRPGDFTDTAALTAAIEGVDAAFVMVPPNVTPAPGYPESVAVIASLREALAQAPPSRVVALSSIGSEQTSGLGLITATHLLEQALSDLPCPTAFVRAGSFFENFIPSLTPAAATGILYTFYHPTDRPVPSIATEDIGRQVAALLAGDWTGRKIVELGTPVSPDEIALAMTKVLGRPVEAQPIPRDRWASTWESFGMPAGSSWAYEEMCDGVNSGWIHFGVPGTEPVSATLTAAQVFRQVHQG